MEKEIMSNQTHKPCFAHLPGPEKECRLDFGENKPQVAS
jgi:hypothetical protein